MNASHYFTLILGTVLTVAPQFLTTIPGPYRDLATALLGAANAYYHLLTPPPAKATA